MRAAGIAVEIPTKGRPVVRLVVTDDSSGTTAIEATALFTSDDVDLATQLDEMSEAVRSRLQALKVDRVVIRRADIPPRPSNREGPRLRLLMEGAVGAAARSAVLDTRL